MHCPRHVSGESRAGNRHRRMFCASGRKRKYILLKQKKQFYAFQWPFSRMFQWGRLEKEFTADGLTTWFRLYFSSFLWCLFFPSPSSCKIGVWLNTCKLCCDYQPLKSSFRNKNLYIVKSPRLLMSLFGRLFRLLRHFSCVSLPPCYQKWPSTGVFDLLFTVCADWAEISAAVKM